MLFCKCKEIIRCLMTFVVVEQDSVIPIIAERMLDY